MYALNNILYDKSLFERKFILSWKVWIFYSHHHFFIWTFYFSLQVLFLIIWLKKLRVKDNTNKIKWKQIVDDVIVKKDRG